MNFRNNRGNKLKSLLEKENIEQELDDFWKDNKYFGNLVQNPGNEFETDEDFNEEEVKSQQQDLFDSDFGNDTDDESDEDAGEGSQEKTKKKKSKFGILKKIKKHHHHKHQEKTNSKDEDSKNNIEKRQFNKFLTTKIFKKTKKTQQQQDKQVNEEPKLPKKKFIHEKYSQSQLLQEAVWTEYYNLISLQELIKIEEEKKIYSIRKKFQIMGPKLIFKDSLNEKYIYCSKPELVPQLLPQLENQKKQQPERIQYKYRDPKTHIRFNTLDEYKRLRSEFSQQFYQYNKNQLKHLSHEIKMQTELIEKKEEQLATSYHFHGKSKHDFFYY